MLTLKRILNRAVNVPEPQRLSLSAEATVDEGAPFALKDGVLTAMKDNTDFIPQFVSYRKEAAKKTVLAYPVNEDMVFEIPLSDAPASMIEGKEYLLSEDGLSLTATAASGSYRGALLFDLAGAEQATDKVLIRFPRA